METLQATTYALYAAKVTVSGMRTNIDRKRTAVKYSAAVLNEDGTVLEVRQSWDIAKLFTWLESFGFDVSLDKAVS